MFRYLRGMPMCDRLTYSRSGYHPGKDPLENRTDWLAYGLAFLVNVTAAYLLPFSLGSLLLVGLLATGVMSGVQLTSSKIVRPRVFDREQREHEIVPFHYATEEQHS